MQDHQVKNKYEKPKLILKSNWKTIFFANSGGFSSKRVCGVVGWLCCLIILGVSFIYDKQVNEFADYVLITSASLLGVDSLTGIFTKGNRR